MRTIKAAELILDFDLYPRNNIDPHNVRNLIDALAAGSELPPILIDKKSKRVIDGFHRIRAYLNAMGDEVGVTVIEKNYHNEQEMFLDAMRFNADHGAKLDSHDRTHCVLVAERLKIPAEAVAGALHVTVDKLASLRTDRTATSGSLLIPIKRTIQWKAGTRLNKAQVAANEKLSGMNQQFYANQLITLLESELIDSADDQLIERLQLLHRILGTFLTLRRRKAS
jgi:hypothetical protein